MYAHSRSYETRTHGDEANAIILLGFPKARCSMLPPAPLGHFPSEAGGRMPLVAHGLCDGWLAPCTMVHARQIHASCSRVCLIGYRLTGCMVRGSPLALPLSWVAAGGSLQRTRRRRGSRRRALGRASMHPAPGYTLSAITWRYAEPSRMHDARPPMWRPCGRWWPFSQWRPCGRWCGLSANGSLMSMCCASV